MKYILLQCSYTDPEVDGSRSFELQPSNHEDSVGQQTNNEVVDLSDFIMFCAKHVSRLMVKVDLIDFCSLTQYFIYFRALAQSVMWRAKETYHVLKK